MKLATSAGALRRWLCAFALILPVSPALAEEFSVTSGLSAHWFNPDRSGEGLVLEILSDDAALLYWFTYDEEGNQRWLIDVGEISGDEIIFPELTVTRGGRFGPNFDPNEVEYEVVGEAILSFSDCDHGEFSYAAFDQSETISVVRLSQTMAAGCQPIHGVPGQPVREYAGQSGSWYDPTHSGEGYTLQWMSRDQAVLIWFSYDLDGNQYWMIGTGTFEDGKIDFPVLYSTGGTGFGEAFNANDIEYTEWGSLTLDIDCGGGTAQYDSEFPEFGFGMLSLDRLTHLSQPACPWKPPQLSDLYELSVTEIPVVYDGGPTNIQARDIADDGTVIAVRVGGADGNTVYRWRFGDQTMDQLGSDLISTDPVIVPDSSALFAMDKVSSGDVRLKRWRDDTGWQPLQGLIFERSILEGASQDRSHLVGRGSGPDISGDVPWIWSADNGQVALNKSDETPIVRAFAASNDGSTVVGDSLHFSNGSASEWTAGLRWVNDNEPQFLYTPSGQQLGPATSCNFDCSLVAGGDTPLALPDHPHFRQAWYWKPTGEFGFLGELPDTIVAIQDPPYLPRAMSGDGSIIVGHYATVDSDDRLLARAFIWTQNTGITSSRSLTEVPELKDSEWGSMNARSISRDGSMILIEGRTPNRPFTRSETRAYILHLTPK
ncbi:hypothetical protein G4Y73_10145 [Wenzhouxiangella sp. XN201]|uniref:hypothetical protein n=1 Tax=Wenzhouxiangella sp. XN201 TaxID=2710755 RepID=UPI0013C96062|nr:hypothetical protein [Wenzhouxiangella sp. XN201]NEZ04508.1 hypothetical protein [Wenzhouxiangella sp. XN201]